MVDSAFASFPGAQNLSSLSAAQPIEMGYGASLTDLGSSFQQSIDNAQARVEAVQKVAAPSVTESALMKH